MQGNRVVSLRVHEMKSVTIFVTKLEILSLDLNQLHFVGRTKTDVGALAGVNITDDRLDERAQISGRAMMNFEHNGRVAVVFNRHSFAKIVCRSYGIILIR